MKKYKLKEIIFLSLIVASILVVGYLLLPFMQILPIPAYRALLVAPLYALGVTVLTSKVKKIGIVSLMGLLLGALLSTFFIWMFLIATIGGVLTDITCWIFFKGYRKDVSVAIASGLFPAYQLPITFVIIAYTLGGIAKDFISKPIVIFLPTIITFILGYLTSKGLQKVLRSRDFESI